MPLPPNAGKNFLLLAEQYGDYQLEFPILKAVTLAQWADESGWGNTKLSSVYGNYAGMKWGSSTRHFGSPVRYAGEAYAQFTALTSFIEAYWARLDDVEAYKGWRRFADNPEAFLMYITPPWLTGRAPAIGAPTEELKAFLNAAELKYVREILAITARRTADLFPQTGA